MPNSITLRMVRLITSGTVPSLEAISAGQGINLAIRDSIVAANHLIQAIERGEAWDEALCERIEAARRPEVEAMQSF